MVRNIRYALLFAAIILFSSCGVIEKIKTHHNVAGLPTDIKFKAVLEPLKDLYKDEVRKLAAHLDIPVSKRQPFPGPGLAIRIMGEATPEATGIVKEACWIMEDEIIKAVNAGEMTEPWQYFAAMLPIKSVGVHGDIRAYGYTIVIRAVIPGCHDRELFTHTASCTGENIHAHHQRHGGCEPGCLRYHEQTPGHNRVGVVWVTGTPRRGPPPM